MEGLDWVIVEGKWGPGSRGTVRRRANGDGGPRRGVAMESCEPLDSWYDEMVKERWERIQRTVLNGRFNDDVYGFDCWMRLDSADRGRSHRPSFLRNYIYIFFDLNKIKFSLNKVSCFFIHIYS